MPQAHGDVGRIGISGKTVKRYQRRVAIRLILVALAEPSSDTPAIRGAVHSRV
jgi:hypothetical protein